MQVNHRGSQEVHELHVRIEDLEAENARLREALVPFADFISTLERQAGDGVPVAIGGYGRHRKTLTVGDIRRAKAALTPTKQD